MTTVYATIIEATNVVSYSVPASSTDDQETAKYKTLADALASFDGPANLVVAVDSDDNDKDFESIFANIKHYELGQIRA